MRQSFVIMLLVSTAFAGAGTVHAQSGTSSFREIPGACPGEGGCTFGEWTAKDTVSVYAERSTKSAVLYRVRKGDKVRGLEAVLAVANPRTCVVQKATLGHLPSGREKLIPAGTKLTILYYEGEGYALTEYQNVEMSISLIDDSVKCSDSEPDETLWLKVRSKSGRIGWTNERQKFLGTSQYD